MSEVPSVELPLWCTTDDLYDAPGEPWDNDVRKVDPGSLVESGYEPNDQPTVREWNYHENAQGQWLKHLWETLQEVRFLNWKPESDSGVSGVTDAIYLNGSWIVVGDEQAEVSTSGVLWGTLGTPTGLNFHRAVTGDAKALLLAGSATVVATTGTGAFSTNVQSGSPVLINAAYTEPLEDKYVIVGVGTGVLDFYYGAEAAVGVSHFTVGDSFAAPALDSTASTVASGVATNQATRFAYKPGGGKLLCLVTYIGTAEAEVYQYLSEDGGETFTATADVFDLAGTTTDYMVQAVAYDADRDLWVAITADGGIYTSSAAIEAWSKVGTLAQGCQPNSLYCVNKWWAYLIDDGQLLWTHDAGLTWRFREIILDHVLVYAPAELALMAVSSGGFTQISLSVGALPSTAITPP